jgi:hypothetical protein
MSDISIVDTLFSALLNRDTAARDAIGSHRATECACLRALISTDRADAIDLDSGLSASSPESPRDSGLIESAFAYPGFRMQAKGNPLR